MTSLIILAWVVGASLAILSLALAAYLAITVYDWLRQFGPSREELRQQLLKLKPAPRLKIRKPSSFKSVIGFGDMYQDED